MFPAMLFLIACDDPFEIADPHSGGDPEDEEDLEIDAGGQEGEDEGGEAVDTGTGTDSEAVVDAASGWFTYDSDEVRVGYFTSAGDVDGDGKNDLVLGTRTVARDNLPFALIVPGPLEDGGRTLGSSDIQIGYSNDISQSPWADTAMTPSVSVLGDLNGDGYDDIGMYVDSRVDPQSVYLFWGPLEGTLTEQDADMVVQSPLLVDSGSATLYRTGDLDRDGVPDWGLREQSDDGVLSLYDGDGENTAIVSGEGFRYPSLSGGRDLTGDGTDDLLMVGTRTDAGPNAFLLSGPVSGHVELYDQAVSWERDGNYTTILAADDLNGDGHNDVVLGDALDSSIIEEGGTVYISYGPFSGPQQAADNDVQLVGDAGTWYLGGQLERAGNLGDNDATEFLIGASNRKGTDAATAVYRIGGLDAGVYDIDADFDRWIELADVMYFNRITSEADLTGDGYDDVIVGTPNSDDRGGVFFTTAF